VKNPLKVSVLPVCASHPVLSWIKERKLIIAPIGRAGQPIEVATPFVFLASADSSYFTAQVSFAKDLCADADSSASTSMEVVLTRCIDIVGEEGSSIRCSIEKC
jgi:hypothetical protein